MKNIIVAFTKVLDCPKVRLREIRERIYGRYLRKVIKPKFIPESRFQEFRGRCGALYFPSGIKKKKKEHSKNNFINVSSLFLSFGSFFFFYFLFYLIFLFSSFSLCLRITFCVSNREKVWKILYYVESETYLWLDVLLIEYKTIELRSNFKLESAITLFFFYFNLWST